MDPKLANLRNAIKELSHKSDALKEVTGERCAVRSVSSEQKKSGRLLLVYGTHARLT